MSVVHGLEPTWELALRTWWAYTWRAIGISLLGAFVFGFITGVIAGVMGLQDLGLLPGILGFLFSLAASLWVMHFLMTKGFKGYRIVVVEQ